MNQPNFLHELKWLGCKVSMVGSPFWIGKTGNNSVYGEVAEMGKGSRKSSLATWSTGTFHDRTSTIDSPAIHIKTALIQSPHIPIERTLHWALQVVHFRGGGCEGNCLTRGIKQVKVSRTSVLFPLKAPDFLAWPRLSKVPLSEADSCVFFWCFQPVNKHRSI